MFASELSAMAGRPQNDNSISEASRLSRGLRMVGGEERELAYHKKIFLGEDKWSPLLANWEAERLDPSSCRLRTAILMVDGRQTNEISLAQIIQPAH